MVGRKVTVIPATINSLTRSYDTEVKKRRTAAYARVSTDSDEQFTSYEAQIDYYTQYIKGHDDWEFVKVYADEGISGTNTNHREGFKEMISDALSGKLDLIITKSISRFARNTVDTLVHVRKLRENGVEIYFEKENIYTFDSKCEVILTIMSSLAQEESRSISENVTWGQRKRFADGKVSLPYKQFLGYKKGADGFPEIVPEEAKIVRQIYKRFIDGYSPNSIAKWLTDENIPTPAGREIWSTSTVQSILKNEKYKGDARLQKTFTVDFLTKKHKVNEGEIPQYYVKNSHPAIIRPDEWDMVQREFERRKALKGKYRCTDPLQCRIVCGDCGSFYGSKVWHSNNKYRKIIWRCNSKFNNLCNTPTVDSEKIKNGFIAAVNQIAEIREQIIDDCKTIIAFLCDTKSIDSKLVEIKQEIDVITELTDRFIQESSVTAINQTEFNEKYNGLVRRYETEKAKANKLTEEREHQKRKAENISVFMLKFQKTGIIQEFNIDLWLSLIDVVTIHHNGKMVYKFLSGHTVEV